VAVKYVVPEDQAHLVPADELPPDEKRLREAFGTRLLGVGDPDPPLRTVPHEIPEPGQVDRVEIRRMSRMPESIRTERG